MYIKLYPALSFHQMGQRSNQEDARFPDTDTPPPEWRTFVVCDGVGGLDKGEVASTTVAATIGAVMEPYSNSPAVFTAGDFARVLDAAYTALARCGGSGMATTLTFLHAHSGGMFAAYIGDSRIYQIREGVGIVYRSYDHSLVNTMVRTGDLTPADAVDNPHSNVIMRCMGGDKPDPDAATVYNITDVQSGDYFLLCSDGVLHQLDDESLVELLTSNRSDSEKMNILAQLSADSTDNNTAIFVHVQSVSNPEREDSDIEPDEALPSGTPTYRINPDPGLAADVLPDNGSCDSDSDRYGREDYNPTEEEESSTSSFGSFLRNLFH